MATKMAPLRTEHEELSVWIDELRIIADTIGSEPPAALRGLVDQAYDFLTLHLIPHAIAEDEVLYPAVARLMGAPDATATMSRDHVEVVRLTEQLDAARAQLHAEPQHLPVNDMRRIMYGLHALIAVHFAKEEEIYVPILEARLTDAEAAEVFEKMEEAAHVARSKATEHEHPGSRTLHQ